MSVRTTFTIHPGSDETLQALERNIGFIPNLAAAIAASPTALGGFVGLHEVALEVIAQVAYTTLANYAADVSGATFDAAFMDN
jgi:hypothetical protein